MKERFPHLADRIDMFYGRAEYAPQAYDDRMRRIFNRIRERYGFPISERFMGYRPSSRSRRDRLRCLS